MRRVLPFAFSVLVCQLPAQEAPAAVQSPPQVVEPLAATLGLADHIPWRSDGQEYYERDPAPKKVKVDRQALIDAACAEAKQQGKLVLWYVHRIQEKTLQGRQMYRAPVLDIYARQVLFADPDVSELASNAFIPVRCVMDQQLSDRFGLKPLAFVEPAVVFLDGEGQVVHFVERIRTFHGQWFADLCVRVLEHAKVARKGDTVDELRAQGMWREAIALASKQEPMTAATWLQVARLQRLLRQPEQALDSVRKARALAAGAAASGENDAAASRRRSNREQPLLADAACEEGLVLSMLGRLLDAQPVLEQAWRSTSERAAEAGYWYALNALRLGDEVGAMRRFLLAATKGGDTLFGRRAR
ncbi:MAG TPA: hypothetical protein VFD82_02440, partial [Planctomycetota bacterium]|nr:hypothetical protein [Planctomycetota bacterium]